MVRAARRCVRYSSSDAALGHGSSPTAGRGCERPRRLSKEDGDSLQLLSNVQRQLVQKSFQTYAFEAKIKAKDRDDEHATTANEVLNQALRLHAASVASLHVDGVPSADDYRHRMPRKSLGRLQYEDLTRVPPADTSSVGDRGRALAARAADQPSPPRQQQPRSSLLPQQPAGRHARTAQAAEGGTGSGASCSPSSTAAGDGANGSSSGGSSSGSSPGDGAAGPEVAASPRAQAATGPLRGGSWQQRRAEAALTLPRSTSRLPHMGGGADTAAEVTEAAGAAGRCLVLHRTDSGLKRAEQMLQALRDAHDHAHGPSAPAAGGGVAAASPGLPHIPRPPAYSVIYASTKPPLGAGAFHSNPTSPAKQRHAAGGGAGRGQTVPGGGRPPQPPPPQPPHLSQQPLPQQRHLRTRSPHQPFASRSVDSIPRAIAPPLAPAGTDPRVASQDGSGGDAEFALGRSGSSFSFSAALWRPLPPPSQPPREPGGGGGAAAFTEPAGLRPTLPIGDGGAAPPPHGSRGGIRFELTTSDGDEVPGFVPGGGGGGSTLAVAGLHKAASGGASGAGGSLLLSTPLAPATEQLFTRISRSTARPGPQQQWVPVFAEPLPAAPSSSAPAFTAASCGASPYAAPGLSASCGGADTEAPGWDVAGPGPGRRCYPPLPPWQRPPSGNGSTGGGGGGARASSVQSQRPLSGASAQARSTSPGLSAGGGGGGSVRLPPIHDAEVPADGDGGFTLSAAPGSRRGRARTSLSWSVAEGAATAAFMQRAQQMAPLPLNSAAAVAAPSAEFAGGSAGAGPPAPSQWRAQVTQAAAARAAAEQQLERDCNREQQQQGRTRRERSISTDGAMRRYEVTPAAVRVELMGVAAAPGKGVTGGFLSVGGPAAAAGGAGFAKQRRAVVVLGGGVARSGFAGAAYGRRGGAGGEAGEPGGSPSIMTRMRKALGTFWPRSPVRQ